MKKIYLVLSLAAVSLAFTQSCIKCDNLLPGQHSPVVKQETTNISVAENSSYTYTLPVAPGGSSQITTAASHAKTSTVATDANGNTVLQYAPAANYVGSDIVIVTTVSGETTQSGGCFGGGHGNSNHGGGNCGNHHGKDDQTTITTVHITVTPSSNVVAATNTPFVGTVVN